jgi:hypothetical protein
MAAAPGTTDGQLYIADGLAHQFQPVEQGGRTDDGGAVLVVVEDRDVHALAQLLLDVEALGRLDVFQVDAAQRGLQRRDDVDQLVGVTLGQFDVEHIDAGELLEQAALAFHHRLAGQRADVAQPQHRRAVGDHGHQVAAAGVLVRQRGVFLDRQAGIGHARGIGQRQIALVAQGLGGRDGDLAARGAAVVFQGGVAQGGFGVGELLGHGLSPLFRGLHELQELGTFDEQIPERRVDGEVGQQRVQVVQVAQTLVELTEEQVTRRVDDHIRRRQHAKECPLGRQRHRGRIEVLRVRPDARSRRQDRMVHVEHGAPVLMLQRRDLVHPLPVIALVVRRGVQRKPARPVQSLLHLGQRRLGHHDVDVVEDAAHRGAMRKGGVRSTFEQQHGNVQWLQGFLQEPEFALHGRCVPDRDHRRQLQMPMRRGRGQSKQVGCGQCPMQLRHQLGRPALPD